MLIIVIAIVAVSAATIGRSYMPLPMRLIAPVNSLVGINAKLTRIARYFGFAYCVKMDGMIGKRWTSDTLSRNRDSRNNMMCCSAGNSGIRKRTPNAMAPNTKPVSNLNNCEL